jgi:hypothetical protein
MRTVSGASVAANDKGIEGCRRWCRQRSAISPVRRRKAPFLRSAIQSRCLRARRWRSAGPVGYLLNVLTSFRISST